MKNSLAYCPDCGPAVVNHNFEWFAAFTDWLLEPAGYIPAKVWRATGPYVLKIPFAKAALPVVKALTALRLGTLRDSLDPDDNLRTRVLWESALKRGIEMWEFRLFGIPNANLFIARHNGVTRTFDALPRPNRIASKSLEWMDDKSIMKKRFQEEGIPVPNGAAAARWKTAQKIFSRIRKPVITKPTLGSRSRHTAVHIEDEEALQAAFRKARQLCPWVMIEEEMNGFVFRASVVGGRVVGIARREPAYVMGDGIRTVRELVAEENKNPLRQGPIFHEIPLDEDAKIELARQNLTLDSVPEEGRMVTINQKVSRAFGASITDFTDKAHPENIALFLRIGEVLEDPVVGIDFMMQDITRSWREEPRSGVIELNSMPFLDLHHYPLFGTPRDAAGALWDLIFTPTSSQKSP